MNRLRQWARRAFRIARGTAYWFNTYRGVRLAAGISYYVAFALAPLLIVTVAVAGLILEQEDVQQRVLAEVREVVGPHGGRLVERAMEQTADTRRSTIGLIVGIGAILLGASSAVLTLKESVNAIFGVQLKPRRFLLSTFLARAMSALAVIGLGVITVVAVVANTATFALATWIGEHLEVGTTLTAFGNSVVTWFLITLLVAATYKLVADAKLSWRAVLPGAIFCALAFLLVQSFVGLYLGQRDLPATYGAAASLAIVLVWIYIHAAVLLVGAAFVRAYMTEFGHPLQPGRFAVRVERTLVYDKPVSGEAPTPADADRQDGETNPPAGTAG